MLLVALSLPAFARADAPVIELDPATDTVRVAGRLDGTLTGRASGAAATIGMRWVRANRAALGLSAADLETLGEPTVESADGIRQVRWRQYADGVPVADRDLRVNVDADGRLINVLGAPSSDLPQDTTPRVGKPAGDAKLVVYGERLAYRHLDEAAPDAIYDTVTDAHTGKVIRRTNLVKSATANVWDDHPSLDRPARAVSLDPWLTAANRLEGQWVHVYSDTNANDVADASEEVVPQPYGFQSFTTGIGCESAKPCSWTGAASTRLTNRLQNAVQAFYLANRFRDHLAAEPIGFDGFSGADKVRIETSDGGGTNNANMFTPPDGKPPRMQMYLWSGSGHRSVNSGDDASILFHEYTHGLTGRLVVDADGVGALSSWQAGAMGEGWSDFYAKDYLVAEGLETDTPAAGEIDMGAYMDATPHSTRTAALDCPVGAACPGGGYTYGDFAKIAVGPEYHADGEIWAQTLWDLRRRIGSKDAQRLVTQGLRLSPPEPSFLDARNAILQADAASGGTLNAQIWAAFAARGMGFYASTTGGADIAPVEDFSLPPQPADARGRIAGRVTDADSDAPVAGVTVSVGGHSDGPGALVDTTDADGRYAIEGVPARTYANVVIRGNSDPQLATGYEQSVVGQVTVPAGGTVTRDAELRRNWASVRAGAAVISNAGAENAEIGCGPKQAVDGLAGSVWSTAQTASKKALVVKLPQALDVSGFGIDPGAGCGDGEGSATAQYSVAVGPGPTGPWTQVASGTFGAPHRHKLNFVAAAANDVEYVQLTPMTTQTPGASYIDLSEFSVYGGTGLPVPETTIVSGPSGVTGDSTPTFAFASSVAGTLECRVDGAPFAECASPHTTAPLPDGEHTFDVRGVNADGVADPTPASRAFRVDTKPAETRLLTKPPVLTKDRTATFTFDGGTTYTCAWDGVAVPNCSSPQQRTFDGDGPHRFTVTAANHNGPDSTPASYDFTIDATAPATAITKATVTGAAASISFASPDASDVQHSCTLDGVSAPCTSPTAYSHLADGEHRFTVSATDAAGNTASAQHTFVTDVTPPVLTISSAAVSGTAATFTFASADATAVDHVCTLDGETAPCTSPRTYAGLGEGEHRFSVQAKDQGANTASAARTVLVDTIAPVTGISSATVEGAAATFVFSSTDASAVTHTCTLDGVAAACTSPAKYTGLADGGHTFTVVATDAGGNRTSVERAIVVETVPPETLLLWAPAAVLTAREFTFAFGASEAARFICDIDGVRRDPCLSPLVLTGLSEGAHSVIVTAVDGVGNHDPTPARSLFTVVLPALPPAPLPTVTATPTPAPEQAITSVALAKAASLKTLRRTGKLRMAVRAPQGAKVAVQAKLGSRVIGRLSRTLRGSSVTLQLVLDKKRLRAARPGTSLSVRVQGTGSGLSPATQSLRIRLKR